MKAVLITGAAGGMGQATTKAFLQAGWGVFACDSDSERLSAMEAELSQPDSLVAACLDLSQAESCREAVSRTVERYSGLDAVVNMAGTIGSFEDLETLTPEGWHKVLDTNLMSVIFVTSAAIPHLKQTKGTVVNIASTSAYQAEPCMGPYGVSKAGIVAFTNYAACELSPLGIRVAAISPGWVNTPMAKPFFEQAGMSGRPVPMTMSRRIGEPEDIAATVMFLVSEGARNITGTTLIVDGGQTNHLWPIPGNDNAALS